MIETERLLLRGWGAGEASLLRGLLGDAETMRHWPAPLSDAVMQSWFEEARRLWSERRMGRRAVVRQRDGVVIGDCGLVPREVMGRAVTDLGYIIHADHQRQGYAFEAARAMLNYGREVLGLTDIICHMAEDHVASQAVARKLGLVETGRFVHSGNLNKTHIVFG